MDSRPVTPRARARPATCERGAVLVVVVLVMIAMLGVGHGLLLAARYELVAARAGARQLEARTAAETAVERALAEGGGMWMDSVGTWKVAARPTVRIGALAAETAWRRLGPESWLIEATARGAGRPAAEAAGLAWVLDPLERVLSWRGVVGVAPGAPMAVLGSVDADRVADADPPLTPALCTLPSGAPSVRLAGVTAFHELSVADIPPGLGRLSFDTLLALAGPPLDSAGTPAPIESAGACTDAPWNWGDPDAPHLPCGGHLPLRGRTGDLRVEGGAGQGLLVVDGSLVLTAGARFHGVVLLSGRLELHQGSALTGYALAPGGLVVAADSRLAGSACWARRALESGAARLRFAIPFDEPIGPL